MSAWWSQQSFALQFFYIVGGISGLVLVLQAALTVVGADHSHVSDGLVDHPDGLGVVSIRTLIGFFFGFGWTGAIVLRSGGGLVAALLAACGVGVVFLFGIYLLMRALYGMRSFGNLDYRNAVGVTGTIYVTVPPAMSGPGQIEVLVQGRLSTVGCMTRAPHSLPPGTKVRVAGLIDRSTLEVEAL